MEQHVTSLIPDYILGLLPQSMQQQVESHVANCSHCRAALEDERAIDSLIRQTLQVATQPGVGLLQRSRPVVAPRRQPAQSFIGRQLAPVMVLLAILAGTLVMQTAQITSRFDLPAPGFYRANTPTATSTSTPTATIAGLPIEVPATAISMASKTVGDAAPVGSQSQELLAPATIEVRPSPIPIVTAHAPATK